MKEAKFERGLEDFDKVSDPIPEEKKIEPDTVPEEDELGPDTVPEEELIEEDEVEEGERGLNS